MKSYRERPIAGILDIDVFVGKGLCEKHKCKHGEIVDVEMLGRHVPMLSARLTVNRRTVECGVSISYLSDIID